jgi:phospholipid transport system substrate-binding protein
MSAADTLKAAVKVVTAALAPDGLTKDALAKARRAEQEAISRVSETLFDWESMAKQALGREWRLRTPEEQKEFVRLFAGLIEQNYLATIRRYKAEGIDYVSIVKDGEQVVRMNVATKSPVRIDYRMRIVNEKWRVYDVVIKDSSVVQNYRAQFERILREASYKELVTRIREKTVSIAGTMNP